MIIDYKEVNDLNRYKIMSGTVVPRPIAWIVTDDDGVLNCAPFSYFIPISSNPALVLVAIGQKEDGTPKDSLSNILNRKKATICFAKKEHAELVQQCASPLGKDESEIEAYEINVEEKLEGFPPVIEGCDSALFCEYYDTYEIPSKTTPVILEVKHQYIVDDKINERNHVNIDNLGRSGVKFKAMVDL